MPLPGIDVKARQGHQGLLLQSVLLRQPGFFVIGVMSDAVTSMDIELIPVGAGA